MGLPYSKQIHSAFDQVTPLVAAGFEVLQTTKNIAILLAVIEVITAVTLVLILFCIIGLLFTVNPDLEEERKHLVTPAMQWLASWAFKYGRLASYTFRAAFVVGMVVSAFFLWQGLKVGESVPGPEEENQEEEKDEGKENEESDKNDGKKEK